MVQSKREREAPLDAHGEGALYAFGVDALFTGHVHSYERDYPVWGGQLESTSYVDPRATVHIMVGGAGNDEMDGSAAPAPPRPRTRKQQQQQQQQSR